MTPLTSTQEPEEPKKNSNSDLAEIAKKALEMMDEEPSDKK